MLLTEYQQKTIDRALEKLMDENKQLKIELSQKTKELKKHNDLSVEYGIDGKTMLELAKSQIKTAKSNCKLREELERANNSNHQIFEESKRFLIERDEARAELLQKTQELARYQQAENEGRLIELPYKIGDTVYEISYGCGAKGAYGNEKERCRDCAAKGQCDKEGWHIDEFKMSLQAYVEIQHKIGKTVFLDRAAAEAALERSKE